MGADMDSILDSETGEPLLTLRQAVKQLPSDRAQSLHPATLQRWAKYGLRFAGRVIFLRTRTLGRTRYTTRAWLREFAAQQEAGRRGQPVLEVLSDSDAERQRRGERARAEFEALRKKLFPGRRKRA